MLWINYLGSRRLAFSYGRLLVIAVLAESCGGGGGGGGTGSPPPITPAACTVLASNLSIPVTNSGFALFNPILDNTNIYWNEVDPALGNTPGSIRTISKNGGQVTVLASGLGGVNDMAVDDTNVYWTEYDSGGSGAIKSVPKTGGAVTVLASGTPAGSTYDVFFPMGITFDSTYVYWGDGGINAIRRVSKTGGPVHDLLTGPPNGGIGPGGRAGFIAIDSTSTFFYFNDSGYESGAPGTYSRLPFSGGTAEVLASNVQTGSIDIALDSNFVYSTAIASQSGTTSNASVFEVPTGGGSPIYLVQNVQANPRNLAIDADFVYFIGGPTPPGANELTSVSKIPKRGGALTAYPNCMPCPAPGCTSVLGGVGVLAVDDTDVYVFGGPPGASGQLGSSILAKFPK